MKRCEHEMFYRVFCLALLGIAVTFTLILTNVFIDIDGLLTNKEKAASIKNISKASEDSSVNDNSRTIKNITVQSRTNENGTNKSRTAHTRTKPAGNHVEDTETDESSFRTKRSLDPENYLYRIRNPKVKKLLTNRLATLLEDLDAETTTAAARYKDMPEGHDIKYEVQDYTKDFSKGVNDNTNDDDTKLQLEDDMTHIALHNVLLDGIVNHLDLTEVYNKVHALVESGRWKVKRNSSHLEQRAPTSERASDAVARENKTPMRSDEEILFEEMTKCKKLQRQITDTVRPSEANAEADGTRRSKHRQTANGKKMFINTIVNISSIGGERLDNQTADVVNGIIQVIYNGKTLQLQEPDRVFETEKPVPQRLMQHYKMAKNLRSGDGNLGTKDYMREKPKQSYVPTPYINQLLQEYFRIYPKDHEQVLIPGYAETIQKIKGKRLKRHIKVRYSNDNGTETKKDRKDDDELFVEIETHFDKAGIVGEQRKKLIRNLIKKIQDAIQADLEIQNVRKKKHWHVKRRIQNPLKYYKKQLINKFLQPYDKVSSRHLDPISKAVIDKNPLAPEISNYAGNYWNSNNRGPGLFTASKSINSAERHEVGIDFEKVRLSNGVPQRLQRPLNTEDEDEDYVSPEENEDAGKLKLIIKNIEGTGFSIGFNQYTDQAPDPESIKIFTGLENLIQTYQQKYDQIDEAADSSFVEKFEKNHMVEKRDTLRISRNPKGQKDYHPNEYEIIFGNKFLPYDNYQEIYEDKNNRITLKFNKDKSFDNAQKSEAKLGEDILSENLKPSEIFTLANLFDRRKRSVKVSKITSLNSKMKYNKFINTKPLSTKRFILSKRNKRQVKKIRIITSDDQIQGQSEENYNNYVPQNSNMNQEQFVSDQAYIRETERLHQLPEPSSSQIQEQENKNYEQPAYLPMEAPYVGDESRHSSLSEQILDGMRTRSRLMNKYPHILYDDTPVTKEEDDLSAPEFQFNNKVIESVVNDEVEQKGKVQKPVSVNVERSLNTGQNAEQPNIQDLVQAIQPADSKNFKMTVRVLPKNKSDSLFPGFKEVHTSINKSFNKNGMAFYTLINVSEVSKVEKLNVTTLPPITTPSPLVKHIKHQQDTMKSLLKQHKERIDNQMENLQREQETIDHIINTNLRLDVKHLEHTTLSPPNEYFDVTLTPDLKNVLRLSKDELSHLVSSILGQHLIKTTETPINLTMIETPATELITTPQPTTTTEKAEDRIDKAINSNVNMANEILKRIDRNTEALTMLLGKLSRASIEITESPVTREVSTSYPEIPNFGNWQINGHPDIKGIKRNGSIGIPFVYAYQQHYVKNNKPQFPIASVVYHGHIHTDGIHGQNIGGTDYWSQPKDQNPIPSPKADAEYWEQPELKQNPNPVPASLNPSNDLWSQVDTKQIPNPNMKSPKTKNSEFWSPEPKPIESAPKLVQQHTNLTQFFINDLENVYDKNNIASNNNMYKYKDSPRFVGTINMINATRRM